MADRLTNRKLMNKKLPTQILVSIGTVPLLLGVLGTRALAKGIQDLGQSSEEVFRGDRLPTLKITNSR
jgi:hypothetical protein